MDPCGPVEVIEACGAEVDLLAAVIRRFVDGLAELHPLAEMFGPHPARVQPELPPAVVQVLNVNAANIVVLDHRISPGRYPAAPRPRIFPRPPRGS